MLLAVLAKAQIKVPHKLYGVCLMANHLHLLIRPDDASQLPRLMHWISWYSAMALNRLSGRCGHFWETRYYANPMAAGIRKGFYDPYSNYGHYSRLECDGISEWHPSFLTLVPMLNGCSKRYERFCQQYRHYAKGSLKCHWGSRMLKRLVETSKATEARANEYHQGNSNYLLLLIYA